MHWLAVKVVRDGGGRVGGVGGGGIRNTLILLTQKSMRTLPTTSIKLKLKTSTFKSLISMVKKVKVQL